MRRLTILVMIAALGLGLSACGRKGKPIPPEGSTYPRQYPDINFPQVPKGGEEPSHDQGGSENQYR